MWHQRCSNKQPLEQTRRTSACPTRSNYVRGASFHGVQSFGAAPQPRYPKTRLRAAEPAQKAAHGNSEEGSPRNAPRPPEYGSGPSATLSFIDIPDATQESTLPHLRAVAKAKACTKPYMLLLPDLDGVGLTSRTRWPFLATELELQASHLCART